ncbi:hypothetical protein Desti_5004 [Desulfomonile tiedjei DSM 6799]|uniref:Uncharacterized protein n=1 Tax=Desulfomonile tiedjei (strain ATCC 49306 / DSM 6799 / DCB-1) TaxID=706587 RepID=I4CDH5_DESTA|nr:hypothetical protein Desti_5004 [Desulfomonile tiedjei DSM 6799]
MLGHVIDLFRVKYQNSVAHDLTFAISSNERQILCEINTKPFKANIQ